ncbi:serine protease gd-like [Hyposmocoma kahamanoa]|uniref:serine protease gd-like n=1 Tax=Hyposmocoma kahamanoa TaxID=1477025 RepID=UPI000E6D652A|nr:serine protease gd-like [Hyposmocoma kahamanoa]
MAITKYRTECKQSSKKLIELQIRQLNSLLLLILAVSSQEQSTPVSPCTNVFTYEQISPELGIWYGVIKLSTESALQSLWLNIILDSKAEMLGNWVGNVTTTDNIDYKIINTNMKIQPGPSQTIRFFIQYNPLNQPPKLQAIKLNGREICNANNVESVVSESVELRRSGSETAIRLTYRPESTRPRPESTRPQRPESRPEERPNIRPEDRPVTKPVYGIPAGEGPVYIPTLNQPGDYSNPNPYSISDGRVPAQNVGSQTSSGGIPEMYPATPTAPSWMTSSRPKVDEDDFDSDSRADPAEYFTGERPTIVVPSRPPNSNNNYYNQQNNNQGECGRVMRYSPNPLIVNGKPTYEGQWPWQIALYQTQTVDNKYICGGTLVSHSHVITAAHCVTRRNSNRVVNRNTLTVYLGKHNLRTSVDGVQIRLVSDIKVHPEYNASAYSRDLGILELREPVTYTDWVRPACLWPENEVDLANVIGETGSVVGWGFDITGTATEELTLVEMPVVDQETCIRSYSEFFARFTSEYTFCAGYRDGTSVCNGDSGGGMVFNKQNRWYLRGLVSLSVARQNEYRCDPTHYVVFTDLAKFLPWIKQNINEY